VGAYGLLGSGEFEDWAEPVDRWLVDHVSANTGRVLVAPTACAPEGGAVWDRWANMGLEHYRAMGLEPEVLPLRSREDANDPAVVAALDGASAIFFSGGNPAYLSDVLRGSPLWEALRSAAGEGAIALGGCSAGTIVLGEKAPDSTFLDFNPAMFHPGLALFPAVEFAAHWDAIDRFMPGAQRFIRESLSPGNVHVFVDERTAMVGDGDCWEVLGAGTITVGRGPVESVYRAGDAFAFSEVPAA